jgi:microcystin-dependent protein
MAVEYTPRFGVAYWDSDNDDFSRSQLTLSHNRIEERGAIFRQDVFAQRGDATTWTRSFFYDTTNAILYFSDGTSWKKITDLASSTASMVAVSPSTPTADAGTSDQGARIDHRHATPPWGTSIQSTHTSNTAGSTAEFARIDHRHAIGAGSVVAGTIASGAINNANAFTSGVVETSALNGEAVTREKISSDQRIPVGAIMPYAGATEPDGWLFCDGLPRAKASYPALWAVLSTQNYGSDTNNFNTPDLLDRMPRGAATTGTTLGTKAGSDAVTIAPNNIPNHNHSATGITVDPHPSHTHNLNQFGAGTTTNGAPHVHFIQAQNTVGQVDDNIVISTSGAGFGLFYVPSTVAHPNNDAGGTLKPNYFSGGGYEQPVANSYARLRNNAVTTLNPARNTDGASNNNAEHSHALVGNTGNPSATLSHTVGGTTGNPTGTVGQQMTVLPKTQTVNYIIKT